MADLGNVALLVEMEGVPLLLDRLCGEDGIASHRVRGMASFSGAPGPMGELWVLKARARCKGIRNTCARTYIG